VIASRRFVDRNLDVTSSLPVCLERSSCPGEGNELAQNAQTATGRSSFKFSAKRICSLHLLNGTIIGSLGIVHRRITINVQKAITLLT
jgi:hypothetical protein